MGVTKWIFTGLGWVTLGPIGALLGYFVGSTIEGRTQGIPRFNNRLGDSNYTMGSDGKPHRRFHNTGTQDDIDVALLVLIASVMKADGTVHRSELDYVKRFLAKNYGEEKGKVLLGMLRDLVKPETYIDIDAVCLQIKQNSDYTTRYHMVDFLFGLSVTDNSYTTTENTVMRAISFRLGINQRDYISMFTRHVSSHTRNRGSADGGGYSNSSYSSTSSSSSYSDPYKVLGLDSSATDEEVKKAYRRLAMKYHPDKVENMGEEVKKSAEAQFRKINEAYEQIKTARGMK